MRYKLEFNPVTPVLKLDAPEGYGLDERFSDALGKFEEYSFPCGTGNKEACESVIQILLEWANANAAKRTGPSDEEGKHWNDTLTVNLFVASPMMAAYSFAKQVISVSNDQDKIIKDWFKKIVKKNQHLMPLAGDTGLTNLHQMFGYGYQWWLGPKDDEDSKLRGDADPRKLRGDFCAMGIYGQMVYVSPEDGIIIAKNAADPNYPKYKRILTNGKEENTLPTQTFRAFREIARRLRDY